VIVGLVENSGSNRHKVVKIDEDGVIVINRLLPAEAVTADMASWSILIELNKNNTFKQFKAELVDKKTDRR
jgi:hypothetical protein